MFPDFAFVREVEIELVSPPQLVLLYRRNSSRLTVYPSGTAFPVWHADGVFLITAAHCIEPAEGESLHCFYNGCRTDLDGEACEIFRNEELDVATIFLNEERIVRLLQAVNALPTEEKDTVCSEDLLRIFGFPQSKNKNVGQADFKPSGVALSILSSDQPPAKSNIQTRHRTSLAMNPRAFVDDEQGRSYFLQKFEGMSGGPASREGGIGGRVCGVFVEWDKHTKVGTAVKYSSLRQWLQAEIS